MICFEKEHLMQPIEHMEIWTPLNNVAPPPPASPHPHLHPATPPPIATVDYLGNLPFSESAFYPAA